ncbi:MAG: T9SS type A sorting domain-containing protein, partial [Dinghuibacter sp.]|nr:T9SS type A sorting domain-containing protein [Dinghuibacter sp.]
PIFSLEPKASGDLNKPGNSWAIRAGNSWAIRTGNSWSVRTGTSWSVHTGHSWSIRTATSWSVRKGNNSNPATATELPVPMGHSWAVRKRTEQPSSLSALSVFPQPASGNLAIQYIAREAGKASLLVFDMNGHLAGRQVITLAVGTNHVQYNVGSLKNGTYLLVWQTPSGTEKRRIVVQH